MLKLVMDKLNILNYVYFGIFFWKWFVWNNSYLKVFIPVLLLCWLTFSWLLHLPPVFLFNFWLLLLLLLCWLWSFLWGVRGEAVLSLPDKSCFFVNNFIFLKLKLNETFLKRNAWFFSPNRIGEKIKQEKDENIHKQPSKTSTANYWQTFRPSKLYTIC